MCVENMYVETKGPQASPRWLSTSFKDGAFHWSWALPIGWTGWLGSPSLEVYLCHPCTILVAQNHNLFDVPGHCILGVAD